MNIISGKPSPMPRLSLFSAIVVMLVFSGLVGLNVQPRWLGAHLTSTDFGHCSIARGWPAYMVFESHRFDAAKINWKQNDVGVPLEETNNELQRMFKDAAPWKGYFAYSALGIVTNTLIGLAILVVTVLLCGLFVRKFSLRAGKSRQFTKPPEPA